MSKLEQRIIVTTRRNWPRPRPDIKSDFGRRLAKFIPPEVEMIERIIPGDAVYITLKRNGHAVNLRNDPETYWTDGDLELRADILKRKLGMTPGGPGREYRAHQSWKNRI